MRRLVAAALALGLLLAGLFALPWLLVDGAALGTALASRLSEALGEPVEIDSAELALFPLPAVRIHGVRVGSVAHAQPLLVAREARLSVSLLALLAGRVALRSLELESPRVHLETDGRGFPLLPRLGSRPRSARPPTAPDAAGGAPPWLAITRLRVRDGALDAGAWHLERVQAAGNVKLDLAVELTAEAELAGVGALRDARLRLGDRTRDGTAWQASARLQGLELGALRALVGSELALWGELDGAVRAHGRGARLQGGELELAASELDVRTQALEVRGPAELRAELGATAALDLTRASVRLYDALEKPAGAPLRLTAELGAELAPDLVRSVGLESEPLAARAELRWTDGALAVSLDAARLEFAPLHGWWQQSPRPDSGALVIHQAVFDSTTQRIAAHGAFEAVSVELPSLGESEARSARLTGSGPFWLEQSELRTEDFALELGGQRMRFGGHYDLAQRAFGLEFAAERVDLARLSGALSPELAPAGRLDARGHFQGGATLASIRGEGQLELVDAFLPNASIPWPVELRLVRRDAATQGEQIDRLSARFQLERSVAHFGLLALDHAYGSLVLSGDVALPAGELDLAGEIVVRGELDAELGGEGRDHVLQVEHLGGTWAKPELRVNPDSLRAMRSVFGRYAEYARAQQQLERAE